MSFFLVDTNFFIQAHRSNYPLDVVGSFWHKIKQLADDEIIISIDKVRNEIFQNDDDLKKWCKQNLSKEFFKDTSLVVESYQSIIRLVSSMQNQYSEIAINKFSQLENADAWLVAFANSKKGDYTIVTHEKSEPLSKKNVKIPDVCLTLDIKYCNTIEMFRELGEKF